MPGEAVAGRRSPRHARRHRSDRWGREAVGIALDDFLAIYGAGEAPADGEVIEGRAAGVEGNDIGEEEG